jgi:hypothetical protein
MKAASSEASAEKAVSSAESSDGSDSDSQLSAKVSPSEGQPSATTAAAASLNKQPSQNNPNEPHEYHIDPNGFISDDEDNSWADDVSLSDDSNQDDYYDQEYGEENSPTLRPDGQAGESKEPEVKIEAELEEQEGIPDMSKRVIMNCYCTEYDIIKKVARKECYFKVREYEEDYDGAVIKGESG